MRTWARLANTLTELGKGRGIKLQGRNKGLEAIIDLSSSEDKAVMNAASRH